MGSPRQVRLLLMSIALVTVSTLAVFLVRSPFLLTSSVTSLFVAAWLRGWPGPSWRPDASWPGPCDV